MSTPDDGLRDVPETKARHVKGKGCLIPVILVVLAILAIIYFFVVGAAVLPEG